MAERDIKIEHDHYSLLLEGFKKICSRGWENGVGGVSHYCPLRHSGKKIQHIPSILSYLSPAGNLRLIVMLLAYVASGGTAASVATATIVHNNELVGKGNTWRVGELRTVKVG